MAYIVIQALLVALACSLLQVQAQQTIPTQNGNCSTAPNDTQVAYEGWFHKIDCNVGSFADYLLNDENVNENVMWGSPDYFPADDEVYQCTISNWMTGEILLNKTVDDSKFDELSIEVHDVQASSDRNIFKVDLTFLKVNRCRTQIIKLNVTTMKNEACSDPVVRNISLLEGKTTMINCKVHGKKEEDRYPTKLSGKALNYTIEWLYNCSRNLPSGVQVFGTELKFTSVSLQQPGIYTCAVSYNGQTRYVNKRLCVSPKEAISKPTLNCKLEYLAKIGQNLTVECTAILGYGTVDMQKFIAAWNSNNLECNPDKEKLTPAVNDSGHACQNILKQPSKTQLCNPLVTDAEELESKAVVTVQLVLRKIAASDLGTYKVVVKHKAYESSTLYIEIKENVNAVLLNRAEIIGLGVGICIFLILILTCLYYLRFYLSYFTKRWFASYEEDNKMYGAFLSYHFSTEIDTFAQQQIRDVSASIIDVLDRMGFRFYDERRDEVNGFRTESTINLMDKSHRVIIILTHQYVTDNWSVFHLQQGFMSMIESGSKLIFILPPGLKEHIKQHAPKDDTYRMIQRAISLNYSISWSPTPDFNRRRFSMKLQHAMPKLRPIDKQRLPSGDSVNSHYTNGANGLSRFLSNTTTTTEVFPDNSDSTSKV